MLKFILLAMLAGCGWSEDWVHYRYLDDSTAGSACYVEKYGVLIGPCEVNMDGAKRKGVQIKRANPACGIEIKPERKWKRGFLLSDGKSSMGVDVVQPGDHVGIFSAVLRDQVKAGTTTLAAGWLGMPADSSAADLLTALDYLNQVIERQYKVEKPWLDE